MVNIQITFIVGAEDLQVAAGLLLDNGEVITKKSVEQELRDLIKDGGTEAIQWSKNSYSHHETLTIVKQLFPEFF